MKRIIINKPMFSEAEFRGKKKYKDGWHILWSVGHLAAASGIFAFAV